jgi:acetyl esterase/lipase
MMQFFTKMKEIILLMMLLIPGLAMSQPVEVLLWENGAPNSNGITSPEVISSRGFPSNVSVPKIYLFLPKSVHPTSAVLICPGGGYGGLAITYEGYDLATWLNEQGIAAVVLKYRMPKGSHEVPVSDARQAMRMIRQNAQSWNIDPDKVGIAGFSAGGHLASIVSTHVVDSTERPNFAVLFYPVITMNNEFTHPGSRKNLLGDNPDQLLINQYSNELQVSPQTPPTLIFLGDDDRMVLPRNSIEFYAALKRNNVKSSLYIFPKGGHGFGMKTTFEYHDLMLSLLKMWLHGQS